MGFWGTFIVTRADKPLPELPALRDAAELVMWHGRGPGGWLMLDRIIGHIIPDAWPKIVYWDEEADQPVMEAEDDPDYQRRYQAALDQLHAIGPAAPGAAPLAVRWAAEGDLQPDPGAVAAALEAVTVFCSEAFFDLLSALGIPDLADEVAGAG
jgi:hypothetical protein